MDIQPLLAAAIGFGEAEKGGAFYNAWPTL